MSLPDDPFAEAELPYYAFAIAWEYFETKQAETMARCEFDHPILGMTPSEAYKYSREAADFIINADLTAFKDETMPELGDGIKYLHNKKIEAAIAKKIDELVDVLPRGETVRPLTQFDRFNIDFFTTRGKRVRMEDRHVIFRNFNTVAQLPPSSPPQGFFGVYDGHGGFEAAKYVQAHLHDNIAHHEALFTDTKKAIYEGWMKTDKDFLIKADREGIRSGSTAVTALIREKKMWLAWAGDSQCVLIRNNQAELLTPPHKPNDEGEKKRIEEAGGIVINRYGTWRVNAMLAVSRAFGDANLKDCVIADPDIVEVDLDESCQFLILACDGLWDFMDKEKVAEFVIDFEKKNEIVYGMTRTLVDNCIKTHSSTDNISIIVIQLKHWDKDFWTLPEF
eukprot:m.30944 g.30944  ORF g.30944 m.30944 type:complete len:393 (+) comp10654_c3_seq1:83-1261(+)